MDARQLEIRRKMRDDFAYYAPRFLRIKPPEGGLVPFIPTEQQLKLHAVAERQLREKGRVRIITAKGRRTRTSSYVQARFFHKVTHRRGAKAFVAAHDRETTQELFGMTDRFYRNFPVKEALPAATSNSSTSLEFDEIESGYSVGTAANINIGRGFAIQYCHCSEVAFWPKGQEIARGLLGAVSDLPGTEIWIESTGNGMGDWFHSQVQAALKGESDYEVVFLEWWLEPQYQADDQIELTEEEKKLLAAHPRLTIKNLAWRRKKIASYGGGDEAKTLFMREYPFTIEEIFVSSTGSYISSELVAEAVARDPKDAPDGPLVVGIDPGGGGEDPTAVIARRGHRFLKYWLFNEKDPVALQGKISVILAELQPRATFVDTIGIGLHLSANLSEKFPGVRGVDYRRTARDSDHYMKVRDECAGLLKEWLAKASIPDDPLLRMELSVFKYKYLAGGQLKLESKDDAKERGHKSPNIYDALAITMAEPVDNGLLDDSMWLTWPHKPFKGKPGSEQLPDCNFITAYAWITDEQWCVAIVGVFVPDSDKRRHAEQDKELANAIVLKCVDGEGIYHFMDAAHKLYEKYQPDYFYVPSRATMVMKDLRVKNLTVRRAKFETIEDVVAVGHDVLKEKCAWVRNTSQGERLKSRLARYPHGKDQALYGCVGLALAHLRQRGNLAVQWNDEEEQTPRRRHESGRRTAY